MSINDSLQSLASTLSTELPLLRAVLDNPSLSGDNWPLNPAVGTLRFRVDLGLLCYYDGVQWLTATEYEANSTQWGVYPATVNGMGTLFPYRVDYSYYITRIYIISMVETTNNDTNYWNFGLCRGINYIRTRNTSAQAPWVRVLNTDTINAVYLPPDAQQEYYGIKHIKVGSPGGLVLSGTFRYRLVIP